MIGVFSKTLDSNFVEALGFAGMDFVILDQEHGPVSNAGLYDHVRAARASSMKSIVRVKGVDANAIGAALDAGADGVQVPNISTPEEAEQAVKAAKFFPLGNRGVCRFVKAAEFGRSPKLKYFDKANEKLVILQVEGKTGIQNLEKILDVENFDILFIGPYDLSQSLGIPGQIDHPEMKELMNKVAHQVKEKGKRLGTFADSVESAKYLLSLGFEYLAYSVDINIFLEAAQNIRKSLIQK